MDLKLGNCLLCLGVQACFVDFFFINKTIHSFTFEEMPPHAKPEQPQPFWPCIQIQTNHHQVKIRGKLVPKPVAQKTSTANYDNHHMLPGVCSHLATQRQVCWGNSDSTEVVSWETNENHLGFPEKITAGNGASSFGLER